MVPTICAWHLPTNQLLLPITLCLVPSFLPTNASLHLLPSYLPTYQWYLPTVLGTLLPSYLLPYLPPLLGTYLPTNHLLGYVADTERGRERVGLHLCRRRSFHGFFSQSRALNCSPVRRCCCSSRSLYVSVCM